MRVLLTVGYWNFARHSPSTLMLIDPTSSAAAYIVVVGTTVCSLVCYSMEMLHIHYHIYAFSPTGRKLHCYNTNQT